MKGREINTGFILIATSDVAIATVESWFKLRHSNIADLYQHEQTVWNMMIDKSRFAVGKLQHISSPVASLVRHFFFKDDEFFIAMKRHSYARLQRLNVTLPP